MKENAMTDLTATEALTVLQAAGKGAEAEALISDKAASVADACDAIRADETRSDVGKQREMAIAYSQHKLGVEKKLNAMASQVTLADRDDAARVFGTKGLTGDAASLVISRRDAADRVAAVTDREELRTLLKRATRSGDEVLARAIAERAVEDQDDKTMNLFIADRPDTERAAERLWAQHRAKANTWGSNMLLLGLVPPELQGMSSDALESLAQTPEVRKPASVWSR